MAGEGEKDFVEHGVQVGDYRMSGGLGCELVGDSQPGDGGCQETLCFRVKRSARRRSRRSRRSRSFWRKRIKEPRGSKRQHMESGVVELTVMYLFFGDLGFALTTWLHVKGQVHVPLEDGRFVVYVRSRLTWMWISGTAMRGRGKCWKTRLPGNSDLP